MQEIFQLIKEFDVVGINKFIGIGNLTKDPEVRYMPNGEAVTNVTIACNDSYKDKTTGEKKEVVEFVRVVFFRKLAEIAGQYLKKGSQVYIEGSLKTRKWEKDGHTNYTTEIVADSMQMLGSRQSGDESTPKPQSQPVPQTPGGAFNDFEDDIPFN